MANEAMGLITRNRVLSSLRDHLYQLKVIADQKRASEQLYKEQASVTKGELLEIDGENGSGVRFEYEGKEYAAIVCQPGTPKIWDLENLVPWLKKNGHWDKVKTTILDPEKLAAEISMGNISATETEKFQLDGTTPTAYVKFVNPKPDSK